MQYGIVFRDENFTGGDYFNISNYEIVYKVISKIPDRANKYFYMSYYTKQAKAFDSIDDCMNSIEEFMAQNGLRFGSHDFDIFEITQENMLKQPKQLYGK